MNIGDLYIAIKIDIIKSRSYSDRDQLQKKFLKITDNANKEFDEFVVSRFIVTHGDELQGLLKIDGRVIDVINFFLNEMNSLESEDFGKKKIRTSKIRFGIGIGTLNTSLKPVSIGMDGQAFYFAKEAIDIAHSQKKYIVVKTESQIVTNFINTIFDLMFSIRKDWSVTQIEIISFIIKGYLQESIAKKMGISQPAVSKHLKRANWESYHAAENTLRQAFDEYDRLNEKYNL